MTVADNPLMDLSAAALQIVALESALCVAKADRNKLVVEALDQGCSQSEVALAARMTQVNVHHIKRKASA